MAKPELGIKRICPSCASRFYDLTKRPIVCPKCAFSFEPEMLVKQRRTRVPEPVVAKQPEEAPAAEEEVEDTEDEREEETAEAEEEPVEAIIDEAPLVVGTDGDEDEEEEAEEPAAAGMTVSEGTPEEAFEDEDVEDDDEADDTLLEEVGEDEDDVAGIIDTDIPTKEEP